MANIKDRNGNKEIRFSNITGKYASFYAGRISHSRAESIGRKLERMVSDIKQGDPFSHSLSQWIADLDDSYHQKLVKLGLVQPRVVSLATHIHVPALGDWIDQYLETFSGKDSTKEQLEIAARSLRRFFDDTRCLDSFTKGDAEQYRRWLEKNGNEHKKYKAGLAINTVRRRIGRAKQFFNSAIDHELIQQNPFRSEASATSGNPDRFEEIPAQWVIDCMGAAPDEDFRLILALARFGGLRRHECSIQRWEDIDIPNRIMKIRSNKTPPVRWCPIFPELLSHLIRAREMGSPGAGLLQQKYPAGMNLTKQFQQCCRKAELQPWGKPWQNLRATRETELMTNYPAKDVATWLGNSVTVAAKHYLMPTQEAFQRAITEGCAPKIAPKSQQDSPRQLGTESEPTSENPANGAVCLILSEDDSITSYPARTETQHEESRDNSSGEAVRTQHYTQVRFGSLDRVGDCLLRSLTADQILQLVKNLS